MPVRSVSVTQRVHSSHARPEGGASLCRSENDNTSPHRSEGVDMHQVLEVRARSCAAQLESGNIIDPCETQIRKPSGTCALGKGLCILIIRTSALQPQAHGHNSAHLVLPAVCCCVIERHGGRSMAVDSIEHAGLQAQPSHHLAGNAVAQTTHPRTAAV